MVSNAEVLISVYDRVVRDELNWMLLHYPDDKAQEPELYCSGSEGLEEMKNKVYDLDAIFIGFYCEENGNSPGYILINYIPISTPPIRRARALVHSRRIGVLFKKHQTMLTVDSLSQLTVPMIHKALVEPEFLPAAPEMGASLSTDPAGRKNRKPKPIPLTLTRRSFSETYAPHYPVPQQVPPLPPLPGPSHKTSGMLGGLLRRNKKDDLYSDGDDLPPPPPPKDLPTKYQQRSYSASTYSPPPAFAYSYNAKQPSPIQSLSELGIISHEPDHDYRTAGGPAYPPALQRKRANIEFSTLPLKGKWARDGTLSFDPREREQRRREAQRQRELEDQQAQEEERQRQLKIKWQKEEDKRLEEEEEEERRVRLEEELRWIAAERERKRRWEEEEERRKRRELEERKRADRERRLDEHRRLDQWRMEREEAAAAEKRRSEEQRRRQEAERQQKIQQAEQLVVQAQSKEPDAATGWVTIQFHDSLFWKRRYYRFMGKQLHLYRSPKDTKSALEKLELYGKVEGLKEWKDGYEELEAIPYSFVVEFKDSDMRAWSMFADSEQEKFRFLGLVHHSAGL